MPYTIVLIHMRIKRSWVKYEIYILCSNLKPLSLTPQTHPIYERLHISLQLSRFVSVRRIYDHSRSWLSFWKSTFTIKAVYIMYLANRNRFFYFICLTFLSRVRSWKLRTFSTSFSAECFFFLPLIFKVYHI